MTEITAPQHAKGIVHHQIADTAKGLCGEFWEQMATGAKGRGAMSLKAARGANRFYKKWPSRETFVGLKWPDFIPTARQALQLLLGKPGIPEAVKADIHAALLLDGTINPKTLAPEAAQAHALLARQPKR
jgi:hypothetical protein